MVTSQSSIFEPQISKFLRGLTIATALSGIEGYFSGIVYFQGHNNKVVKTLINSTLEIDYIVLIISATFISLGWIISLKIKSIEDTTIIDKLALIEIFEKMLAFLCLMNATLLGIYTSLSGSKFNTGDNFCQKICNLICFISNDNFIIESIIKLSILLLCFILIVNYEFKIEQEIWDYKENQTKIKILKNIDSGSRNFLNFKKIFRKKFNISLTFILIIPIVGICVLKHWLTIPKVYLMHIITPLSFFCFKLLLDRRHYRYLLKKEGAVYYISQNKIATVLRNYTKDSKFRLDKLLCVFILMLLHYFYYKENIDRGLAISFLINFLQFIFCSFSFLILDISPFFPWQDKKIREYMKLSDNNLNELKGDKIAQNKNNQLPIRNNKQLSIRNLIKLAWFWIIMVAAIIRSVYHRDSRLKYDTKFEISHCERSRIDGSS